MSASPVPPLPSTLGDSRIEDLVLTRRGYDRLRVLNALLEGSLGTTNGEREPELGTGPPPATATGR